MFRDERITGSVPYGWSVDEIIGQMVTEHAIHPAIIPTLRVYVWSQSSQVETLVPFAQWRNVRPKPGCSLRVRAVPMSGGNKGGGGKSPLKLVAMVAVMVVAAVVTGGAGAAIGASAWGGVLGTTAAGASIAGMVGGALAGAAVSLAGNALINAMIPTSGPANRTDAGSYGSSLSAPTFSITGMSNKANPFGVVPKIYGRRRVYPMLAASSYSETAGNDQYIRALFCFGYGPLSITDIKIGETPVADFASSVEYELRQGYSTDTPVTLFTKSVHEDGLSAQLTFAGSWVTRTTRANTDEITVDVTFPRGLTDISTSSGARSNTSVSFTVEYSPVGANTWTLFDTLTVTNNTTNTARGTLRKVVTNGQYDVRMKRTTADSVTDNLINTSYWTALRSITSDYPINMTGLALLAVRIKASEQINGSLDSVNAICTSVLPIWNGSTWLTPAATRNPAWAWCDVLRGSANSRPTADADIDLAAILDWASACDATSPQGEGPMWQYDAVHDRPTTVDQMLRDIAAAGRARYIRRDGNESILRDVAQTTAFQHFTPRNSWGFRSVKTFVDHPHALKCRFVNPDQGYQEDEVLVYYDGYTVANASLFEQLDMLHISNHRQAWRDGRYHMAATRLRPAIYELNTDVENFACQPGDLVYVAYDVPLWGQWQSRIQDMTFNGGGDATSITLDSTVTMATGVNYVVRIRRTSDNGSLLAAVNTVVGEQITLTFTTPVPVSSAPAVDDLVMFGETNEESVRLLVKSISRGQDLSAKITLVDEAPAVHTSYAGSIPTFVSNISQVAPVAQQLPPLPSIADVWDNEVLVKGSVQSRTYVTLTVPSSATVAAQAFDVQYRAQGSNEWLKVPNVLVGQDVEIDGTTDGQPYEIRARSLSRYGLASEWVTTTYTSVGLARPPEDVTTFLISVLDTTAYLSWTPVTDVDVSHYVIKWTSATTGADWNSAQILVARVDGASITVPALTGTYLVKAVDYSNSESVNAKLVTNNVSGVLNMNIVDTITESPTFAGAKTDVNVNSGALELTGMTTVDDLTDVDVEVNWDRLGSDVYPVGTYDFANSLDLGYVFTSRLTASITAVGINFRSLIDAWTDVDAVADWDGLSAANWDIELQVRTSNDNATWGAWTTFVVGDYQARAFQWRIILYSYEQGVTPSISGLTVTIDMPDRLDSDNDVTCPTGGLTVTFAPAFKIVPAVAVADQNLNTGDYKTISAPTTSGFTIQYFNAAGTPVERTLDWVARGYGYVA